MSKLNGLQIFALLSDLNDGLIVESVAPALLTGGGVASHSVGSGSTIKRGLGAWLAKGGWLTILAGVLVASAVAVGVILSGIGQESKPPVGSEEVTVADTVDTSEAESNEPEETTEETSEERVTETPTEEVTEGETAAPHDTHVFGEWDFAVKPTCTEGGTRQRVCTVAQQNAKTCARNVFKPLNIKDKRFNVGDIFVDGFIKRRRRGRV